MTKIRTMISDIEMKKDLIRTFKYSRSFEQKMLYLNNSAGMFYDLQIKNKRHWKNDKRHEHLYKLLKENFFTKGKRHAVISLGCGNSHDEKILLNLAHDDGYDLTYFGVDSSMMMLEFSDKQLADTKFYKEFILADFASENFSIEFKPTVKDFDEVIYLFIGGTFGNVPQSYIADAFRNITNPGDYMFVDVTFRENTSELKTGEIFERYMGYLNDKTFNEWVSKPLKLMGLDGKKDGEFHLEIVKEEPLKALNVRFLFTITKKKNLSMENLGGIVTLLPEDTIEVLNIRVYDVEALKKFIQERDFVYVDEVVVNNLINVVFKRK